MSNTEDLNTGKIRLIIFALVAAVHILLILFAVFKFDTVITLPEPVAGVMKLVDLKERIPPPEKKPEMPNTETQDAVAENMIETEVPPPPLTSAYGSTSDNSGLGEQFNYLEQRYLSVLPVLPEDEIRRTTVYPPIAQRSGIEGTVIIEYFIDSRGVIRDVRVLREDPPGRGFGEAAVNAFKGIVGKPAEANGVAVAARVRHPVRFVIK